jgi:radical SAM superfamily enzyme YgiQ (UPF0313 family)
MPQKLLLVNPNLMKPVVTPVALDYLAQAVEQAGFAAETLDLAFADDLKGEIDRHLENDNYLLIAVTVRNIDDCYYASQDFCLRRTREIIECIRARTEAPVVLGGVGFSAMAESVLDYCGVGLGVQGEGEWSLPRLAEKLADGEDPGAIPGMILRAGSQYRSNPVHFGPLEKLRLSRRDAIDNLRYFREGGMVGFETKRGCSQKCTFCADPLSKGRVVRSRDPGDVAEELSRLYQKGIDHFHTCDSEFNVPEEQAIRVCEEIVKKGLGERIYWYAYASPTPFSRELAQWMKRAGCVGIDFGVDHGHEGMLECLGRSHHAKDIEEAVKLSRGMGFTVMCDLLLGATGETRETIAETIDLMKKISPDRVGISLGVRLYRGTALTERVVMEEGLGVENRNLHGAIRENERILQPIFYLPASLGEEVEEYIERQIEGDPRFLLGNRKDVQRNYNYNQNSRLMEAIKQGYRGAFWDILRRVGNSP